jgi:hypothetical protein
MRIDTKRTECEANDGSGGPSQTYGRCRRRHSRAGIDKGDDRLAIDDRTKPTSLPTGPSEAASGAPCMLNA